MVHVHAREYTHFRPSRFSLQLTTVAAQRPLTTVSLNGDEQAIVEARWSPDRDTVVLGGEDSRLYLYSTGDNFDLIATAEKHKHPVRALVFAVGAWMASSPLKLAFGLCLE